MKETNVEKGIKFENEVAEIYRNFDNVIKIVQNHSLRGIQIDIYVEMRIQGGTTIKLAIDAKNYNGNLPSSEARKCIDDFNVLRNDKLIDTGIIVSSKGFSKDANNAIITSGYEAVQMKDLKRNALDFTKYLIKWIEKYELEKSKIIKYISLSAKKNNGASIKKLDSSLY